MIDKAKKNGSLKRGRISEEDISTVLERYTATTVLALLQEVGQFEGVKIDWNAIVKKTSTGISSVRECQMLWRHLAYRHCLLDKLDDGAQLLDDDSDLEFELEAYPDVSNEASAEAAACVKVLMASGLPTDANQTNAGSVEAPLTINIPNSHSFCATSENSQPGAMRGMNITIPISVQKQPTPMVTASDGMDVNGSQFGNNQSKRKRKPWTEEEDLELIAAVRKYGEGNWANIVKCEFKGDRTPSQLSQRWGVIRRKSSTNFKPLTNSGDNVLNEALQATRYAMNMALHTPQARSLLMNTTAGGGTTFGSAKAVPPASSNESLVAAKQEPPQKRPNSPGVGTTFGSAKAVFPVSLNESSVAAKQELPQKSPNSTGGGTTFGSTKAVPPVSLNESSVAAKQELPQKLPNITGGGATFGSAKALPPVSSNESSIAAKQESSQKRPAAVTRFSRMVSPANKGASAAASEPNLTSDPVRAAAVAAGARIASQSDAASLLKAAQANNAVHIISKAGPSARPPVLPGSSTHSETRPKANQLPFSTAPSGPRKNASPSIVHRPPPTTMKISSVKSRNEPPQPVRDGKTVGSGIKVCSSSAEAVGKAEVHQEGGVHGEQVKNNDKTASGNKDPKKQNGQIPVAENPGPLIPKKQNAENGKIDPSKNKPEESRNGDESKNNGSCSSSKESEKKQQPATQERRDNDETRSANKQQQQQDVPKMASGDDGCHEKLDKVGRAEDGADGVVKSEEQSGVR